MKNIRIFLSENFHFLVVKFSVYLNRARFRNRYEYIIDIRVLRRGRFSLGQPLHFFVL